MANAIPVPTLSEDGWVFDPLNKANYLMSYFFEADYSQSQFYYGRVSSLGYLLQQYGTNPSEFASELETTLKDLLEKYLDNVEVEAAENLSVTGSQATVNLYVSFSDKNGNKVTLSNMLLIENSKLVKVVNLYNTGTSSGAPITS